MTLEELREMLRRLNELSCIGDAIYQVRERAFHDENHEGDSWDHPDVVEYAELVKKIEEFIKP